MLLGLPLKFSGGKSHALPLLPVDTTPHHIWIGNAYASGASLSMYFEGLMSANS